MNLPNIILAGSLLVGSVSSHALQVLSLSLQGEVARINQVSVKFDEAVANFGDPKAAAPLTLQCSDASASQGSGRWLSDRQWVYDFATELPPGVRCSVHLNPELKSARGPGIERARSYTFNSGGPFVQRVLPTPGAQLEEEQFFILQLSGPATPASVLGHVGCAVQGVGERIAVRLIDGAERAALLASQDLTTLAAQSPLSVVTLACTRRLTPGARMQLVYGQGVATPATASNAQGVANTVERRFDYRVREPFAASLSCERENARAACLPMRPIRLSFSAPVQRKLLDGLRLTSAKDNFKPSFEEDASDAESVVNSLSFKPWLPEQTTFTLELPAGFKDASGRTLSNAGSFPLTIATGPMPPLAKFAAAPFGIVERFAEPDGVAMLPITLRHVEADLAVKSLSPGSRAATGQVSDLIPSADADIIAWFRKIQQYNGYSVPRDRARADTRGPLPPMPLLPDGKPDSSIQTRMLSLLQGQPGLKTLDLPQPVNPDPRPFEVVGIPLSPGFHVLEVASPRLGTALLDERLGANRTLYVRTSVLVTNLAVHFKLGRDNALAWVTTLDKGTPVANARVAVSDCRGREVASATSNAQGMARFTGISPQAPVCDDDVGYTDAYFVSARAEQAGVRDMAFTWSDWHKGIEPWRFNLPTSLQAQPDERAHTIFDRTLLSAGETVSMKHLLRTETSQGFGLSSSQPDTLVVTHVGGGQQYSQPLAWRKTATGGHSAESSFALPPAAKLGVYEVELRGSASRQSFYSGEFRVEEFRLPVLQGRITPSSKAPLVNAKTVPLDVQVNYVSGGGASQLPVRVSALVRNKTLNFSDFEAFSFSPPQGTHTVSGDEEEANSAQDSMVITDKRPLTLDKNGTGKLSIDNIPTSRQPQDLLLEASYFDPNGEVQTLRSTQTLWPASVVAGIKTEGWVSSRQNIKFQALALNLSGKPQADVALQVKAIARITTSSRKRLVGGFYSYDNQTRVKELGNVCSGKSDARGLLLCETKLTEAGEVELVVTAQDAAGNSSQAASSVYVTQQGELWFGGEDHDRIDLIPEKKSYQPGETARFQVRMPFRFATALLTVEREGVLHTEVVTLNGQDPTIELKVKDGWGPNVFVSVLALRGRLREVPWYSFFTWGFKAPREWWTSFWYEGKEYVAPTALVDLSKPAFRLGVAEIRVGTQAHQLAVSVAADKESYAVRSQAKVTIKVKLPNGQPAANAEVALAAVDQALLELMPNTSWDLLDAMLQRRSWGVETSTAQMEIIGRRHYGRKAVAAGGGGGHSGTRELLDTLLLWNPSVKLDANGSATVTVPLNDALTTFQIVAVADASTGLFGTGSTSIRATQDLQIISGLPPLVREDDVYRAQITLRNTTKQAMKVVVTPRATLLNLEQQTLEIPGLEAREAIWTVRAPAQLAQTRFEAILWEIEAKDTLSGARDALKASQRIIPAVPLTVQQATLVQIDGPLSLPVNPPADALPGRGGLKMSLQPKLADGLPGVKDWFANYPFACLEQKASKAIGLRDGKLWQSVAAQIPSYLDRDGLASYFPPRDGEAEHGSDTLTAYLLAASHEATGVNPAFALSDDVRASMERGLINFVEGKIQRNFWSPRSGRGGDLDVRKLAAIEALSRHGKAQGRLLGSITIAPNQWPTHAVIDWLNILKRVQDVPDRGKRLAEAMQVLKSRISYQGTKMIFSTERDDYWWWLMQNGDVNTARLMLAVIDDPAWKDDMGRLANGFINRQQGGAWHTTTANLWGGLALEKFSAKFETVPVSGNTKASMGSNTASVGSNTASVDWSKVERIKATDTSGAAHQSTWFGAPAAPGNLTNNSLFLPWGQPAAKDTLSVVHQGTGKPWLALQSVAAVQLKAPFFAGYQIKKTITPVEQANKSLPAGSYTRGDILRITLEVTASADMSWAVITDPVPGGATILGSGLGRDSEIATRGEKREGDGWSAFEERSFEAFRSYYQFLPKGTVKMAYTVRLNNVGEFSLPPSRVEAMYAPEMFGEAPNARVKVEADK